MAESGRSRFVEGLRQPWVVGALALLLLILVFLLYILFYGGDPEQDRLSDSLATDNTLAVDPERRCSEGEVFDRIKAELFRQAGQLRGRDQEAFERLAGFAVMRPEAPILRGYDQRSDSVTCSAYVALDLPPGVGVAGGRRTLTSEVGYSLRAAAGGGADRLTVESADGIIAPLSNLMRTAPVEGEPSAPAADILEPAPDPAVLPPPDELAPLPSTEQPAAGATAQPSFDCDDARTRSELAVCEDPRLAALDRAMAAQYRRAESVATAAQRTLLQTTRDRFLAYREGCRTSGCYAEAYRGRMREISDIMAGRWRSPR